MFVDRARRPGADQRDEDPEGPDGTAMPKDPGGKRLPVDADPFRLAGTAEAGNAALVPKSGSGLASAWTVPLGAARPSHASWGRISRAATSSTERVASYWATATPACAQVTAAASRGLRSRK